MVDHGRPEQCRSCPQREAAERSGGECPSAPGRKAELRQAVRASLAAMTPEVRRTKSQLIVKHLLQLEEFNRSRAVMAYVALEREAQLWPLLRAAWALGKDVALPRVEPPLAEPRAANMHTRQILPFELREERVDDPHDHTGLEASRLGILEPKSSALEIPVSDLGLVLVPCVAYDRQGYRLGKGGGFYDRFLARSDLKAAVCGVAFSEQVFTQLPRCPFDVPVRLLVTETGVVDLRKKA